MNTFQNFPDEARLWIYTADRLLTKTEQTIALEQLNPFFSDWVSHGRPVIGATQFLEDRFLLVVAHIVDGDISGCGIDASAQAIKSVSNPLDIEWVDGLQVIYRDMNGMVQTVPRPTFRTLVKAGTVTADTPVFDTALTTFGAFREGQFEQPAGATWHSQIFRIPELV